MNGDLLLDSNIVIALFAGDASVQAKISAAPAVYLSVIVLGELYYGAEKSGKPKQNIERVTNLADSLAVMPCDSTTAREYGRIKEALRAKGRPIPENDIWISAMAIQHGLTLATRDRHFQEIPNLLLDTCS